MPNSRYEEYSTFDSSPFVLWWRLYRTAAHSTIPANWHENLEVQYCNEGEGYALLDGKRYSVNAGDVVVANSNSLHFMGTKSSITFSSIIIDPNFCKDIGIDYTSLLFEPIITNSNIPFLFNEIYEIMQKDDDPCKLALLKKYAIELLIELRSKYAIEKKSSAPKNSSFFKAKEAITYIQNNYTRHFSLEEMASALFIDKCNLIRKFKKHTGTTIIKYTNTLRCEKAKHLITEGMPIYEAALSCGFNNMSFFTKTFKSCLGKKPSDYKPSSR